MLKPLKNALTATMLSAVAITPVATVSFLATADIAEAKGKKEKKEKRESKKRTSKGKKGGKPTWAGKKSSKASGKSGGSGGGAKMAKAEKVGKDGGLHASQLGNMNGALHANENAILAHIRNGNTSNGPIGHMAALAIAGYDRDAANDILSSPLASDYAALDDALAAQVDENGDPLFEDYAAYQTYLDEGGAPIAEIDDAKGNIGQSSLTDALGDYGSYEEYELAVYGDGTEENPGDDSLFDANIEAAQANLGAYDAETADSFADANDAVADYDDAMTAMLDYWNKGDADSEDGEALQQMLEDRLATYEGVGDTIEEQRAEEENVSDVGDETCDEDATDCDLEETALLDE